MESRAIVGTRVDAVGCAAAARRVCDWAEAGESRAVVAANVHVVMTAHDDPGYRAAVAAADLVVPDGVPLVWTLRGLGVAAAGRVYGPELMLRVAAEAARRGIPVGLYGSTDAVLDGVVAALRRRDPALAIPLVHSPPFRPLDEGEAAEVRARIAASGARIVFVGLGCPRQERWMAAERGRLPAVMLGVGAAFDFIAGRTPQAPAALQRAGMEWAFRLATEPRRLWRRYLVHNPRFAARAALQVARARAAAHVRTGTAVPEQGREP